MFSKSCPKVSAGQVLKVVGLEVAAFDPVYCSLARPELSVLDRHRYRFTWNAYVPLKVA